MMEKYKVLAAMCELDTFTVSEVADLAAVRPSTVRTVFGRLDFALLRVGHDTTGKPGGKAVRYRVPADALPQLTAELTDVRAAGRPLLETPWRSNIIPAELVLTHDTLMRQIPDAPMEDVSGMLLASRLTLSDCRRRGVDGPRARALLLLDLLLADLCAAEVSYLEGTEEWKPEIREITVRVASLDKHLDAHAKELRGDLWKRLLTGPLAAQFARVNNRWDPTCDDPSRLSPRNVENSSAEARTLEEAFPLAARRVGAQALYGLTDRIRDTDSTFQLSGIV